MELGVGGIFAILVIREVLNWHHRRKNGVSEPGVAQKFCHLDQFHEELRRLHIRLELHVQQIQKSLDSVQAQIERMIDRRQDR